MTDSEKVVQECAFPVMIRGVPIPCGRCVWCREQQRKGNSNIRSSKDVVFELNERERTQCKPAPF